MRRCAISCALVLSWPTVGCTPAGEDELPPPPMVETAPEASGPSEVAPPPEPPGRSGARQPRCGHLWLEPAGPWEDEGERLAAVRAAWLPRAEYGRPAAIRRMNQPFPLPDRELLQVRVEHSPRAIQPCWTTTHSPEGGGFAFECLPAEALFQGLPADARPQRAEQWAEVLGTLEDATAVFASERELDDCVAELPPEVRASLPPLGLRRTDDDEQITFVEWIDADETSMLITVHATVELGRVELERRELFTFVRGYAR